ncbi:hypothetical protein AB4099_17470 [Bosea sp. 2KB_26]|uniref:hypothetical protein n=1 Tax=Bosea sp. 2KB_26 TaxID=3237475 RepID=UPI003F8EC984
MNDVMPRRLSMLVASVLCLGLAGCGSRSPSGEQSGMQTLSNIVMFQSTKPPPPVEKPLVDQEEDFVCPSVTIADGGAAIRAQSGPDSGSLRHQISILNVARECTPTSGGGFRLKVGVEGRVLAGPAGGPGSYYASMGMQVLRGTTVVARRAARVGGTIPSGQGGTDFTHVEDGIVVPPGKGDVEIIVGLNPAGAAAPARARRR